jgi:alpha-N-arabinofuranosidase
MKYRLSLQGGLAVAALAAVAMTATGVFAQGSAAKRGSAELTVQYNHVLHAVSSTLYGMMTEEINHSYDGGLYAELIQDRTFFGREHHSFHKVWILDQNAENGISMGVDDETGPSSALPYSLKLTAAKASPTDPGGLDNPGYWGVPVWPDTTYRASIYLKSTGDENPGPVTMAIVNQTTGQVMASATFPEAGPEWKKCTATMRTGDVAESEDNFVRITVSHPGSVLMNVVSLFPPTYDNQKNGDRIDLMKKMAAMHPKFLRLPGGNYLEGNILADWYDWKITIGPIVDRPTHPSPWGYQSSDGMGLLEYLEWCEDLHIQPVLAVYAGYALDHQHIPPGPELAPYVKDALEEIQYVTGSTSTKWGAVRAKDGHPAPFKLKYVEIGNEDFFDPSHSYTGSHGRFAQFARAIRKAYPKLQLIATMPVKGDVQPDVVDDHFYLTPQEFLDDTHHYDKVSRKGPKIFVGEWATMEGSPTPDFGAALSDAAWMTGLERNSDLVIMASYAPMFVNVNPMASQWVPDLIGYDSLHSYGSPSYYAQVMFGSYLGNQVVASKLSGAGPLLFESVTRDAATHTLYVKIVNASPEAQPLTMHIEDAGAVDHSGTLVTMEAKSTHATNTITDPKRIVPETREVNWFGSDVHHTFAPYSINVLKVHVD